VALPRSVETAHARNPTCVLGGQFRTIAEIDGVFKQHGHSRVNIGEHFDLN